MSFYEIDVEQHEYLYFSHVKKDTNTPLHFHSAIELLFCAGGKQEVCIADKSYTLGKGDCCFINSYVMHSLKPSGAEMYAIVGDVNFFQSVFFAFGDTVPPRLFRFENTELLSTLHSIHSKNRVNKASVAEINNAIIKLVLAELNEAVTFIKYKKDGQSELITSILQYAIKNFASDLSLSAIASHFGYSRTYLSRILHQYFGMHWNIYVGNLRARAAHTLIEASKNSSVLDIALSCGFESLNTFYRAYRRVFGKTPLKNDNF